MSDDDKWSMIPVHMRPGLERYIFHGIRPGEFLSAVLSNDLFGALRKADDINRRVLFVYGVFLDTYGPVGCYGSPEIFEAWIAEGGLKGTRKS